VQAQVATGSGYGELVLTSLLVLVIVCAVAWLAVRLLGRWMEGRRVGGGVAVVARVPLEPRRALYVVEAAGRTLLLGSSEMGVTLITELDGAALAAEEGAHPRPRSLGAAIGDAVALVRSRRRAAPVERPSTEEPS
jgi:flagellar biosynthetic protein FliO